MDGFFLPIGIMRDYRISPGARILYAEILAACQEKGFYNVKNKELAELYGVTENTISRWAVSLRDRGYIRLDRVFQHGKHGCERVITIEGIEGR